MLIAIGGGGTVAPPPPSPPPAPPPPPGASCTLHGDSVAQSAPSHGSSLFGSLWHAASSGASSAWHAAAPIVSPVEHLAHSAYDGLLKPDIEGVLKHQQVAKDIVTTVLPGTGQALSTAIGATQDYFGAKSPSHGSILGSLRASASENNPVSAAVRLAEHPKTTLATGFHLAMLGSWLIPGGGELADAGVHVAIAGGREVVEHVGVGAARDALEHSGSKIAEATKLGEASVAKTVEPAGRVFWSGGERALSAATAFAEKHGLETIGMSDVGKAAERAEAILKPKLEAQGLEPWTNGVRDIWARASADFAEHAEGVAHVFLRQNARLEESIWARVERPILEKSEKIAEIVKHDVF